MPASLKKQKPDCTPTLRDRQTTKAGSHMPERCPALRARRHRGTGPTAGERVCSHSRAAPPTTCSADAESAPASPTGKGRCITAYHRHWRGSGGEKVGVRECLSIERRPQRARWQASLAQAKSQSQHPAIVTEEGCDQAGIVTAKAGKQKCRPPPIGQPGKRERQDHGNPVADRQACSRIT